MSRYDYDVRRPMKRKDHQHSGCGVVVVCILVLGLFAGIVVAIFKQVNDAAKQTSPTSVAKVRTDDGDSIRLYSVTVDGTEYLVSDRGGLCKKGV